MATNYQQTIYLCLNIIMLLATLDAISQGFVEGSRTLDKTKFGPEPRGTIKTIEVPENGDMIDCVDIYKQPALNNPLIKKDFQMAPSKAYVSLFNRTKNPQSKLIQNWRRYGECPKGTIPIRRAWNNNGTIHRKTTNPNSQHEYATGWQQGHIYNGAGAHFNIWNPRIAGINEFSLAQLWVVSSKVPVLNAIECGWIVYPNYYHGPQTRLFTYWTRDAYDKTGCYDMECAGFVQISHRWTLGGAFDSVSAYKGRQIAIHISFFRDPETGKWWLEVEGTKLGYFSAVTVPGLQHGATGKVEFGGEITNRKPGNKHTGTHMGSGNFPQHGFGEASYVRNIQVTTDRYEVVDASLNKWTTRPECYNLDFGPPETEFRTHFYYGGPGLSRNCY